MHRNIEKREGIRRLTLRADKCRRVCRLGLQMPVTRSDRIAVGVWSRPSESPSGDIYYCRLPWWRGLTGDLLSQKARQVLGCEIKPHHAEHCQTPSHDETSKPGCLLNLDPCKHRLVLASRYPYLREKHQH